MLKLPHGFARLLYKFVNIPPRLSMPSFPYATNFVNRRLGIFLMS
jgi:hypothetical protein